ncbi:MAG: nodulation protein NfeD [Chloroflexi bacterium]|nr:nodulation protein NfeD [Chloroflexota bacterium]
MDFSRLRHALLLLFAGFLLLGHGVVLAQENTVYVLQVKGVINPVIANYLNRGITAAEERGAEAVIVELDTPGGLATSMEEIMQRMINANVPVVVYVWPQGGRAASAGVFITMAAHVAAMAPSTNIGAAHPVALGPQGSPVGMDETEAEKVTNDAVARIRTVAERYGRNADWAEQAVRQSVSITEREALQLRVVEIIARDLPDLLNQIDGRQVTLPTGQVTLHTAQASIVSLNPSSFEQIFHAVSDPTVAYLLLTLGTLGLIYELANPGAILPGVVGAIAILLAFFGLGTLPINFAGLALILLGFGLFVLEVFISSHGVLGVGGAVALLLGSMMLIDTSAQFLRIAPAAVGGVVLFAFAFFVFVVGAVVRSRRWQTKTGQEGLVGAIGITRTDLSPHGAVFVQGELWDAIAEQPIPAGESIVVTAVQGLHLSVRRSDVSGKLSATSEGTTTDTETNKAPAT